MMTPAAWAGLAIAGGLGAAARFTVDTRVNAVVARRRRARTGPRRPRWSDAIPLGTIAVNLTACLLLGLLAGLAAAPSWPSWIDAVVGTGFLGGYSTFSTASLEGARSDETLQKIRTAGALAMALIGAGLGSALARIG